MAAAEEFPQSIQAPSSTHPGTTYTVRQIPHSDFDDTLECRFTASLRLQMVYITPSLSVSVKVSHWQASGCKWQSESFEVGVACHSATTQYRLWDLSYGLQVCSDAAVGLSQRLAHIAWGVVIPLNYSQTQLFEYSLTSLCLEGFYNSMSLRRL